MTRNESFKRRIRARMAKTGEKYGAARRMLIEQADSGKPGAWVSDPQHTDEVIRERTGRGWEEWRDLIESWPGHAQGHTAVASWLQAEHGIDGWWAQAVTVGWERISGRRLPHQVGDGTFTANTSATITTDPAALREVFLDEAGRADLFPGTEVALRSRATSKSIRLGMAAGVAQIFIDPKADQRATITVQHAKLPSPEEVNHWKAFWAEWLAALDDS